MIKKEIIDKMRADFPPESVQVRAVLKRGKEDLTLTGYKPQYIIERMNDIFGHEGWDFEVLKAEISEDGGVAWVLGRLTVYQIFANEEGKPDINGDIIVRSVMTKKDQFGSSSVGEMGIGDALKGAATNSFEKCASMLDIGHLAYKGLVPAPEKPSKSENTNPTESVKTNDPTELKKQLRELCTQYNIRKVGLMNLTKTLLKKEIDLTELNDIEDLKKLIKHIEVNKAPF